MSEHGALDREIQHWIGRGYHVVSTTQSGLVTLRKPKKFSLVLFFLFLGVFYIPFYLAARDQHVSLWIDEDGQARRRGGRRTVIQIIRDRADGHP